MENVMPSEKFYSLPDEFDGPGGMFEVVWGEGEEGTEAYLYAYHLNESGRPEQVVSKRPSREEFNRLIKALRRARSAVYGSDE